MIRPTIALALLAAACSPGPAADAPQAALADDGGVGAYYPLRVGNRWTYEATVLGEKSVREVAIVGEENGFFVDSQGGQLRLTREGLRDADRYLLRAPLEAGQTWKSVVSLAEVEQYVIEQVGATMDVPAGSFHPCVVVRSSTRVAKDQQLENRMVFARGVGLVAVDTTLVTQAGRQPQVALRLLRHDLVGHAP